MGSGGDVITADPDLGIDQVNFGAESGRSVGLSKRSVGRLTGGLVDR